MLDEFNSRTRLMPTNKYYKCHADELFHTSTGCVPCSQLLQRIMVVKCLLRDFTGKLLL